MRCDDNNHQQRTTCGRMKRTFQTESEWIFFFFFYFQCAQKYIQIAGCFIWYECVGKHSFECCAAKILAQTTQTYRHRNISMPTMMNFWIIISNNETLQCNELKRLILNNDFRYLLLLVLLCALCWDVDVFLLSCCSSSMHYICIFFLFISLSSGSFISDFHRHPTSPSSDFINNERWVCAYMSIRGAYGFCEQSVYWRNKNAS